MKPNDTNAEGKDRLQETRKNFDNHPTCPCSVAQRQLSIFPYHLAICYCNVYMHVHVTSECDILASHAQTLLRLRSEHETCATYRRILSMCREGCSQGGI